MERMSTFWKEEKRKIIADLWFLRRFNCVEAPGLKLSRGKGQVQRHSHAQGAGKGGRTSEAGGAEKSLTVKEGDRHRPGKRAWCEGNQRCSWRLSNLCLSKKGLARARSLINKLFPIRKGGGGDLADHRLSCWGGGGGG